LITLVPSASFQLLHEIHEVTGMKLEELRDVPTEMKNWRRLVKTVARAQRVDSTRWLINASMFIGME